MKRKGYRAISGTVLENGMFEMEFESDEGLVWTFRRPWRGFASRGKREVEG